MEAFKAAREEYYTGSRALIHMRNQFAQREDLNARYQELLVSTISNSAMMSIKLQDWKTGLSQANYALQWTEPNTDKWIKLSYRVAVCHNNLGSPEKAHDILKDIVPTSKDPAIRKEFEVARDLVKKQEKEVTESLRKNMNKAKEVKVEGNKVVKKDEKPNDKIPSVVKIGFGAAVLATVGYLLFKTSK